MAKRRIQRRAVEREMHLIAERQHDQREREQRRAGFVRRAEGGRPCGLGASGLSRRSAAIMPSVASISTRLASANGPARVDARATRPRDRAPSAPATPLPSIARPTETGLLRLGGHICRAASKAARAAPRRSTVHTSVSARQTAAPARARNGSARKASAGQRGRRRDLDAEPAEHARDSVGGDAGGEIADREHRLIEHQDAGSPRRRRCRRWLRASADRWRRSSSTSVKNSCSDGEVPAEAGGGGAHRLRSSRSRCRSCRARPPHARRRCRRAHKSAAPRG